MSGLMKESQARGGIRQVEVKAEEKWMVPRDSGIK